MSRNATTSRPRRIRYRDIPCQLCFAAPQTGYLFYDEDLGNFVDNPVFLCTGCRLDLDQPHGIDYAG